MDFTNINDEEKQSIKPQSVDLGLFYLQVYHVRFLCCRFSIVSDCAYSMKLRNLWNNKVGIWIFLV